MRISGRSPLDSASRGSILPNASHLVRFVPFIPRRRTRESSSLDRWAALVVGLTVMTACATATASREPLVSDRPDFTESAETIRPGALQLEGGHTFERIEAAKVSTTGEILLRVGITPRAELRIEPGSYAKATSPNGTMSGREDGALGVKVRLHVPAAEGPSILPSVSVVLLSTVPSGSRVFRQNRLQPELKLASQWTVSDRVGLATNLNVARLRDENGRYTEFGGSLSAGIALTERVGAYAEVFGFAPQLDGVGRTHYANTGLTFSVTPNVQLDVRGGVGLNGAAPDYFVGAGFARRW